MFDWPSNWSVRCPNALLDEHDEEEEFNDGLGSFVTSDDQDTAPHEEPNQQVVPTLTYVHRTAGDEPHATDSNIGTGCVLPYDGSSPGDDCCGAGSDK
ncbi:hypothetical protein DPMN_081298 [Dreissena polymorpha]|uniref:Uncharacterized protein n=1 Tax=Dreissena polymorpha TaxID=45954 RepID=A0A9D3Y8R9_DREPO|nr:hypothetical protein DPMN_081298 [Dreissena polymorpha]